MASLRIIHQSRPIILANPARLFTTIPEKLKINGNIYNTDPEITNVTQSIINLTDRSLHLKKDHPVGILRDLIEKKLNGKCESYSIYNQFKPVVSVYENFDSLGFPKDHPGRSKSDTYYVNKETLLRTHTSAHELECFSNMKTNQKPGFLITADVYRRDEIDKTHYPAFHQMEGARVWKRAVNEDGSYDTSENAAHLHKIRDDIKELENILANEKTNMIVEDNTANEVNPKQTYMSDLEVELVSQHLKRSIELVVSEVFHRKIESMKLMKGATHPDIPKELKVRWITAYFPWTAPSWEIEVWWEGEWLELCGCGLVQQQVLINSGNEPDSSIAWAFGLGLDRIGMLLFEIPDIRLMWTQDQRFHNQFKEGSITTFTPYSKYPGSYRDIAFWLPENKKIEDQLQENDLMEIIRNVAGDLVESVKLVDKFTHPKTQKKSLCYRINYQSMDRNITNSEVNELQKLVEKDIVHRFQVQLR
ncbi:Phenylalanine--tRNA ligase, mitochondrial [Nakaseomyces bracarensis]|uniref:phenylalanine--tRNA ligase n=1 Tax=Nakaseomyces bracarensis TaxID=273131 RepID=A0ABR4P0H1_9SACH